MSKKVISILLAAAMLVAMMCVGFGAVTAAAEDEDFTYYFLAPDNYCNPEKGAANTDVGIYWWSGPADRKPAAWPGFTMEAAPEVGPNVYKATVPNNDNVNAIIFNANVDAGDPPNEELAKVAHQTANIDVESENYDGMIYVLALDEAHMSVNEFSEKVTCSGDWFKLDEYTSSYNYSTYGFSAKTEDSDSDSDPVVDPEPTPTKTAYHKDDIVTVTYNVNEIVGLGAVNSTISYNADVLDRYNAYKDKRGNELCYEKSNDQDISLQVNATDEGILIGINPTDGEYGADFSAKTTILTVKFQAKKDFDVKDLGIDVTTTKLVKIESAPVEITDKAADYISVDTAVQCDHQKTEDSEKEPDKPSDVDKPSDTPKPPVTTDTEGKEKPPVVATDSDSKGTKDTPDSDKGSDKKDSSNKKTTTSTSTTTTGTTATVQTAGTFTVIALVVILMAAAGVVLYTRKKTEE